MSDPNVIYTKKDIKEIQKIADFYNNYKVIPFKDSNSMLNHKKEMTKIMEDLVNVVAPSILKIADNNNPDTPVGLLLATLVTDNFINEKKFIEVQLNLKELKKLANLLNMDKRLQVILGILV
jgi:hypothetical protein